MVGAAGDVSVFCATRIRGLPDSFQPAWKTRKQGASLSGAKIGSDKAENKLREDPKKWTV